MVMFSHSHNKYEHIVLLERFFSRAESKKKKKVKGTCQKGKSRCKIATYFLTKKWKSKRCVTKLCNQTLRHKFPTEQDSRLEVTGSVSMWCGTNFKFQFLFHCCVMKNEICFLLRQLRGTNIWFFWNFGYYCSLPRFPLRNSPFSLPHCVCKLFRCIFLIYVPIF